MDDDQLIKLVMKHNNMLLILDMYYDGPFAWKPISEANKKALKLMIDNLLISYSSNDDKFYITNKGKRIYEFIRPIIDL